jgi:hypothetical protein
VINVRFGSLCAPKVREVPIAESREATACRIFQLSKQPRQAGKGTERDIYRPID